VPRERTWRCLKVPPFPPRVDLTALGPLGPSLSGGAGGESIGVYPILSHAGYLLKRYRGPLGDSDSKRLARLIAFPRKLAAPECDRLFEHVSWPVAQVTESGRSVGCVLPAADEKYRWELLLTSGPKRVLLTIDWLARSGPDQEKRGVPAVSTQDRMTLCSKIVAIADLFDRHNIVYGDWSYANAFWSPRDLSVYIIDTDSCSFSPRPMFGTRDFEEPFHDGYADKFTDRYRVALLVARCVTGERDRARILAAIDELSLKGGCATVASTLNDILRRASRTERASRPSLRFLLYALNGSVVKGEVQVRNTPRGPAASPLKGSVPARPGDRTRPGGAAGASAPADGNGTSKYRKIMRDLFGK